MGKLFLSTSSFSFFVHMDNFRKPCAIEWRYTAEGELVRVSTRSGRIIPKSPAWEETYDYAKKSTYKRKEYKMNEGRFCLHLVLFLAGSDDTVDAELKRVTFEPKLMTVAEELMQVNGIVETRKRGPVYIY
jgi:large subunit ribosomal protein L24